MRNFAAVGLPVVLMRGYRLIPQRVRAVWSMGSSSSAAAIDCAQRTGNGWAAIARYANPVRAFENQSWDN